MVFVSGKRPKALFLEDLRWQNGIPSEIRTIANDCSILIAARDIGSNPQKRFRVMEMIMHHITSKTFICQELESHIREGPGTLAVIAFLVARRREVEVDEFPVNRSIVIFRVHEVTSRDIMVTDINAPEKGVA